MPSAFAVAARKRARIGPGTPAGVHSPCHEITSKPGKPDSAMVGTSGTSGLRVEEVTPSMRSFPPRVEPMSEGKVANADHRLDERGPASPARADIRDAQPRR